MRPIYKLYYRNLGLNIAFYRKRRGITQEKLAEKIGISDPHMCRIENGDSAASLDAVFAIADALGVDPCKLFERKD